MSLSRRSCAFIGAALSIFVAHASAETCKPDAAWANTHVTTESDILTFKIKGSPATRIVICREASPSDADLKVVVRFEGGHRPIELPVGGCEDRYAKWAFARSTGAALAGGGPAVAKGTFRICRD